ncbi:similar to Saccharomyces cerevisiae YJR056C Putative protein of unknown function [Maudiozyma saulgeensis]|uniref:Uncharacterized protein n=1 Tax=Maudiozyma saulgeensis TaxID=1789683 RepID=A0A1X7R139_9SACH|nr:similar to Saccharomyces cerevisiae YJR056C Putative protein of unknown function [Kazachstania saulgeensis]
MEKLHSLETSLPPEQPPTKQAVDSLNNELSQEFKVAANAVTRLYRVANEKNSLVKHQGYIECLDDILDCIENSKFNSLDDIRLWCTKQRVDKTGTKEPNRVDSTEKVNRYNFNFEEKKTINSPKFRLSIPPLSVEHTKPSENHTRHNSRSKNPYNNIDKNDSNRSYSTQMDSDMVDFGTKNMNLQQVYHQNSAHSILSSDTQNKAIKKIKLDTNNKI